MGVVVHHNTYSAIVGSEQWHIPRLECLNQLECFSEIACNRLLNVARLSGLLKALEGDF